MSTRSPVEPRASDLAPELPVLFEAVIRVAVAPMHAEPRVASPMISQQLAGARVEALDAEGEWARARGEDGYEGWIHVGFLSRVPASSARQSVAATRVSLGCVARTASGDTRALPLRAFLAPGEMVVSGEAVDAVRLADRFPRTPNAVVRTAQQYFAGTSYLWGGVTPWGADCSGLVQAVFALHGQPMPRDAWQQAELGRDAGRDPRTLLPADLLFFSDRDDGRITHVGIAAGASRMVHLGLGRGGYAVERLDASGDAYVEKLRERFVMARRIF